MFLARLLSFALGLFFAWAALGKVLDLRSWSTALAGYRLPALVRSLAATGAPAAEALVAILFFAGLTRGAAALVLGLMAVFSLAIARARSLQGNRLPCGCFGGLKERDARTMIARNTVLAGGAVGLLIYGRDVPGYPAAPSGDAWLPAGLVVVGVALAAWLLVSLRAGFRKDVA